MTRTQAVATESGTGLGPLARLLIGGPLVALLAAVWLISIAWTGWGFETDPAAQLLRDAPWVVVAGLTGAGTAAMLAWVVVGRRGWAVTVGAVIGVLPATVMVTAYFTDAY